MTNTNRMIRGVAALMVLAALLVAAPLALATWWGNPWPAGGWPEVQLLTNDTIVGAIVVVGWLAWLQMTACILIEAAGALRGKATGRILFASAGQQQFARFLIVSVAALGISAGTVAHGSPVGAAPPTTTTHMVAVSASTDRTVDEGHVEADADRGPSITLHTDSTAWRLAETHLGDGSRWREILDLNRGAQLGDGTSFTQGTQTIGAGTTLRLPADAQQLPATAPADDQVSDQAGGREEPSTESAPAAETVTVEPGDTLWDIAEEELGDPYRYTELVDASKATRQPGGEYLSDPDLIKPGWTITIPSTRQVEHKAPEVSEVPPESEQRPPVEHTPAPPPVEVETPDTHAADHMEQTDASTADQTEQNDTDDGRSVLGAQWVLAGLTGAGTLLAAGLLIGLRQRRSAQFRARRPGRAIRPPDPELAPTEMTISAAGDIAEEMLVFVDVALRRLAGINHANSSAMPPIAAVETSAGEQGRLTLHLSGTADLPTPWQSTPDRLHWHVPTTTDLDDLGPLSEAIDPPYPLLVTIGQADSGELWLLNCEEVGILKLTGELENARNLARHMVAQLAVNPWSQQVTVDCIGIAAEATPLREDIHHHNLGDDSSDAIAETIADAVAMVDRATEYGIDVATGRTGQADDDLWPSRLLLLDTTSAIASEAGLSGLDDLLGLVAEQVGRTATSILLISDHAGTPGTELQLTGTGRVILEQAGLELSAASLTSEETTGIGLLYTQSEILDDIQIPADTTVNDGWQAYANQTGGLRSEHTVPRTAWDDELAEPTTSLLDAPDETYITSAAVLPEDLEALAPKVPANLRTEIEQQDPTLDQDYADWLDPDTDRARLTLLGPVAARTHGKALAKRRAYFTELLAFLWFHRRHGATRDQIVDAFGTPPDRVRKDVSILRDWLGINPRTARPYLPAADEAPAAKATGVNVYQLIDEGILVDWDLFKRLRLRGDARGGSEGRSDLMRALGLASGRPCDRLREGGWSWLAEGERHDHYMPTALADVALTVTTHFLSDDDTTHAREATEIALLAAPDEEATRLCLAQITRAEGQRSEAERILRDDVCNRSDDGQAPVDLNDRTKSLIGNHDWLAG